MRIGIVTYHNASNYGAVLQTYALQEAIKKINQDVEIIDYDNRFIAKGLDVIRLEPTALGLYHCVHDIIHLKERKEKVRKFKKFFLEKYNLSVKVAKEELLDGALKYEMGVSGSDQIWNPLLAGHTDEIYFLAFPGIGKRISYASSFGAYKFDNEKENNKISEYLSKYKSISIRDNPMLLKNVLGVNAYSHCDPTLLLSKDEWAEKLNIGSSAEKYILVYALTKAKELIDKAGAIGKKLDLAVKVIGESWYTGKNIEYIADAGPVEFVSAFYNASSIITNSFHGTAFATNFGIPFISVINEKSPERAQSYLNAIRAEDRLKRLEDINAGQLDFGNANYAVNLNRLRDNSMKYLDAVINK